MQEQISTDPKPQEIMECDFEADGDDDDDDEVAAPQMDQNSMAMWILKLKERRKLTQVLPSCTF